MELSLPPDHRFRILRRLGAGGMGVVYEVEDRQHGRICALKTMRADDGQALYRLKGEFRQLQDMAHPNLVRFEELLQERGTWLLAMELIDGMPFLDAARHDRGVVDVVETSESANRSTSVCPSDPARLRMLLAQLADGVASLHAAGKVHCDLKPSNVLVTDDDRVVVLDFGLILTQDSGRTIDGSILGTPLYMSPEQCIGARLTPASDWYSVGAMLYEGLTGRPPHEGKLVQVLAGKQHRDPQPPENVVSGVPADLASLCMALLRRDPKARPTDAEVLEALSVGHTRSVRSTVPDSSRGRFVGREAELEVMRRSFERTRLGKPVAVHVRGGSGLGKTFLVQQMLASLDATVLRGRCYERETVPYKAWDSLIDDLSRYLRRLGPDQAAAVLPDDIGALARVFPVLNRVEAVRRAQRGPIVDRDPEALRRRAVVALSELFGRMAARRPLVLFIDDLQWGDRDSVRLLLELLGLPDPPPVLLLLAYRDEDVGRSACLRELLDIRHRETRALASVTLDVRPLELEVSLELARSLVDPRRANAPEIAETIARESLGSPFFAGELVRALDTADASADGLGGLSLDALIVRRVAALDEATRWLLKTIAVAGGPIPQGAVALAAGLVSSDGGAALDVLRRERLVRSSGRGAHDVVETYHDRIRETIVESLAPSARRERHEAIARAILSLPGADPELVARQWLAAGKVAEASEQLLFAADAADRALAFDHAAELFGAVLDADVLPEDSARDVRRRHADALANAGSAAHSARAYLLCAEVEEGTTAIDLRRRSTDQLFRAGQMEDGLEAQRRLFAEVGIEAPSSDALALARVAWYSTRLLASRFALARPPERIDEHSVLQLDVLATSVSISNIAPLTAMALISEWVYRALAAGDVERSALALATYHGAIFAYPGGSVVGRRAASALEPMLSSIRDPMVHYHHEFSLGLRDFFVQSFDRSVQHLERAHQIARDAGPSAQFEAAVSAALLGWSRLAIGRIREGIEEAREAHGAVLLRGDRHGERCFAAFASMSALAEDDPERARALLDAIAPREGRRESFYEFDGRLMARRIDRYLLDPAAFERMEASWKAIRANPVFTVDATASLARFERAKCALVALEAGVDVAAARRVAEQEHAELAKHAGPIPRYYASVIGAAIAHRQGRREEAIARLLDAEQAAVSTKFQGRVHYIRHRRGALIGGTDGARLVAAADAYLAHEGIANPMGWLSMHVAGFRER